MVFLSSRLQRFTIDIETGIRGRLLARQDLFLAPYDEARRAIPRVYDQLEALIGGSSRPRFERIRRDLDNYLEGYAEREARRPLNSSPAALRAATVGGQAPPGSPCGPLWRLVASCYKVTATLLVSDQEREYTVGLLRGHMLTGRLTAEEFENRVGEAWGARSAQDLWHALRWLPVEATASAAPRTSAAAAAWSLGLGLVGVILLVGSFGLLFGVALPVSGTAWALGRSARRSPACSARGVATAGEVLGVVGTLLSLVLLAGCAALVAQF